MRIQEYSVLVDQFEKLIQAGLCSGGTLAWTKNCNEICRISFGKEYDRTTYYDLASLTKAFVNILALMLVDKGKLSLETNIAKLLDLKGKHAEEITLRHLLTYTVYFDLGNFKVNAKETSYQDFIDLVKVADLKARPGIEFYYTNLAPILVGMVLEQVTGKSMDELVQEYLCIEGRYCFTFSPPVGQCVENFCIETNSWVRGIVHDHTARKAWEECRVRAMCAGLFATIDDIMNFSNDLMAGNIVSQKMLTLMKTNQLGHILKQDTTPLQFGLGVDLSGNTIVANTYIGHQLRLNFESGVISLLVKNVTFHDPMYEPHHREDSRLTRLLTHAFLDCLFKKEKMV